MPHTQFSDADSTVFVIESDGITGKLVKGLLEGTKLKCEMFAAARAFFAAYDRHQTACLVLDTQIPDMSGWQLQQRLIATDDALPLVFVASRIDVSMAVALMRGGAVNIFEKPVRSAELWAAIQEALALAKRRHRERRDRTIVREQIAALTLKEREVLKLMAAGESIASVAKHLHIGARAVGLRRQNLMTKLSLKSPGELMRFAIRMNHELEDFIESPGEDRHHRASGV